MKKLLLIPILFIGFSLNLLSQTVNGEILSDTNDVTIIRVWGTSQERGFAYGYLLGEKMLEGWYEFTVPFFGEHLDAARELIEEGIAFQIDSVYHYEAMAMIDGMVAAGCDTTGITYIDILLSNTMQDLPFWDYTKNGQGFFCSTFMNWGEATTGTDLDGKSVIARFFDHYSGPNTQNLRDLAVIVIHCPTENDLQPWLAIGYVGDMSPHSGLNESGFSIFSNTIDDQIFDPDTVAGYEPYRFMFRKALESADYNQDGEYNMLDIRDAITSNPVGYSCGNNFSALGPITTDEDSLTAMVAEVAPEPPYFTFRTNSFPDSIQGDNLFAANSQIMRNNAYHFFWRYNNVASAVNASNGTGIGSQQNWEIMRDNANLGYWNLIFIQYIPEWSQLKVSFGDSLSPAYMNEPAIYDVGKWFDFNPAHIYQPKMSALQPVIMPNPTNGIANIEYRIPVDQHVTLAVFDIYGKMVIDLVNEMQSPGKHKVWFDVSPMPAGFYFVKLQVGEEMVTRKIVKL